MIKDRPRRLGRIFSRAPIFFVTFCTRDRKRIDPLISANDAFVKYGKDAEAKLNVAIGRYVIMPDHIHLFVRGDANFALSPWIGGLKRAISVAVSRDSRAIWSGARVACGKASQATRLPLQEKDPRGSQATRLPLQGKPLWQPGFFDHVLRSDESYAQKWEYVRNNPVRAGLVTQWNEWPYQGEIVRIDRA